MSLKGIANAISDRNRFRKIHYFMDYFKANEYTKILDVGAEGKEYQRHSNILKKLYPYPQNITVLGIDHYRDFLTRYPSVRAVCYDGRGFPFGNDEFDICWCNAVLEHVGNRERQIEFLREIRRVSKAAFVSTPTKFLPIEPHTRIPVLHYLPKSIFDKLLILFGKPWAAADYMHLLSLRDIVRLLEESNISDYLIKKNHLLGFTVDFVILF